MGQWENFLDECACSISIKNLYCNLTFRDKQWDISLKEMTEELMEDKGDSFSLVKDSKSYIKWKKEEDSNQAEEIIVNKVRFWFITSSFESQIKS